MTYKNVTRFSLMSSLFYIKQVNLYVPDEYCSTLRQSYLLLVRGF